MLNEKQISKNGSGAQSENLDPFNSDEEDEVDVEVDLEGEITCDLKELNRLKKDHHAKYKKYIVNE